MPRLLDSIRPDVVHIPYFNIPVFYTGVMVVTIHDLTYLTHATGRATTLPWPLYSAKRLAYRFVIGRGLRLPEKSLQFSKSTKRDILKNFKVSPQRIEVIYEGVDSRIRRQDQYPEKTDRMAPYVLYVGNAYPHKNLGTLVSGFSDT
jgi:glycosyltransferase involved in cell wall biosynthesis